MDNRGIELEISTPSGSTRLRTAVVGAFNAHNLLAVLGVLLAGEVPLDQAVAALERLAPPAGRMQRLGGDGKPLVVIDYAHTPDALEQALIALRPAVVEGGDLVCVFGCGGDRDAGKRPQMGAVAGRLADRVIVTSDNPRGEDPAAIAEAIVEGIRTTENRRWFVEVDRRAAIDAAVAAAHYGDIVLVAGKGHETYQERDGVRVPFSDAAEATRALAARDRG